jgi:hypothetical protein
MVALTVGGAVPAVAATRVSDRITGTITLEGCSLRPSDIVLRAQEVGGGAPGSRVVAPDPAAGRFARLATTADTHVLRFVIADLVPGRAYHLAIRDVASATGVDFGRCGRLFWKGPFGGFAVAGGAPVTITGYAARTQLEVFSRVADTWVGADAIDFLDEVDSVRTLRWRSNIPDTIEGELQVSLDPFEVVGSEERPCGEPASGIIYTKAVATGRGDWLEITDVDFGRILGSTRIGGGDGDTGIDPEFDGPIVTDAQRLAVSMGAPLWLRVVPQRSSGPACDRRSDGVAGWANVAKVLKALEEIDEPDPTLKFAAPNRYDSPFFDPDGQPKGDSYSYVVVKPHTLPTLAQYISPIYNDPLGKKVVQLGIFPFSVPGAPSVLQPGDYFWVNPGEGGWWDDLSDAVGSLITGVIDGIGFLVDSAAKVYASIKAAVLKVITAVITAVPGVSTLCGSPAVPPGACEAAIKYGLEAAMTSVGLPPSLPNWNQVKQGAVDYAAAELASQTGLPPVVADVILDNAVDLAQEGLDQIEAGRGGSGATYNWVEPYFGFDPAVMYLTLNKTAGDLPDNLVLARGQPGNLFAADLTHIPSNWLGHDTLRVPIVLQADVSDVPPPVCKWGLAQQPIPCSSAQKAIYFRDQFKARLNSVSCVTLNTSTQRMLFGWMPTAAPAGLAISSLITAQPKVDATWGGKFFNNCGVS